MPSTGSPQVIDLLTYNIWVRSWFLLDGRAQRLRWLERSVRGYDVVVLNEAFAKSLCQRLFDGLRDEYPYQSEILGGPSLPRPLGRGLKLWNGGVAILSRWPMERVETRSFIHRLGPVDNGSDKGVVYARINKGGQRYHVLGTHTQAAPEGIVRWAYKALGRDVDAAFRSYRLANFAVIRTLVEDLKIRANEPVIIAGDMNTDRLGAPESFEQMLTYLNVAFPTHQSGHHATLDPATNPLATGKRAEWLDYVLWSRSHLQPHRSHIEARVMLADEAYRRHPLDHAQRDLSDHYAVFAHLEFPSSQ
jgi:endonuclease/exonuclease/phosphatase family metal-dependent hydrolase